MIPQSIQLRLQHQAGQRVDSVWAIMSAQTRVGAADLPDEDLSLPLPVIGKNEEVPLLNWNGFGWTLHNRTPDSLIYVNGEALAPGQLCHVAISDILEIGLSKFLIEEAEFSLKGISPRPIAHKATRAPAAALPYDSPSNDALSGDALAHATEQLQPVSIDAFIDSFDNKTELNINDTFADLPLDAMDELEASAPAASPTDAPAPSDAEPSANFTAVQRTAPKEVLARLNEAYFLALRDPSAGLDIQGDDQAPVFSEPVPDFEDNSELTLEEIISSPLNIDVIAERFSTYDNTNTLDQEKHDDVLWLFAPNGQTPPERQPLPQRSRQDHHLMSLNSSYHLTNRERTKSED